MESQEVEKGTLMRIKYVQVLEIFMVGVYSYYGILFGEDWHFDTYPGSRTRHCNHNGSMCSLADALIGGR